MHPYQIEIKYQTLRMREIFADLSTLKTIYEMLLYGVHFSSDVFIFQHLIQEFKNVLSTSL